MGKVVISIDLNPLSRTSRTATVSISDEISRALRNIGKFAEDMDGNKGYISKKIEDYDNSEIRRDTVETICSALTNEIQKEV